MMIESTHEDSNTLKDEKFLFFSGTLLYDLQPPVIGSREWNLVSY